MRLKIRTPQCEPLATGLQLTDDNDSDTTIIYDISNNSETTLQRDNQHSSTDSQPLNTLSPVPFDNNVIHLQTDGNKTFVQCEDYDSDETYLSNTEQLSTPKLSDKQKCCTNRAQIRTPPLQITATPLRKTTTKKHMRVRKRLIQHAAITSTHLQKHTIKRKRMRILKRPVQSGK